MAVTVFNPIDGRVTDSNGLPIVGALRYVYNAQTTTLRACFTDAALTIPAANPQISIADGTFPRVFTAAGTYKIRQTTSAGAPLGTDVDDIDSGLSAGAVALPIANGGTGASTASAARANLGAASTSDVTALAAQITGVTTSLQSAIAFPQGRLTLTSQTPILAASVAAASTVFYTPYTGQLCPIYDGAQFNAKIFPELTLTLSASHVLNSIYDVYIINDATDGIKLVTSAAWSNIIAGSCSRSGTADLTRLNGLLVNAAPQTMRNGGTTYNVAANQGTYVGSIYMDGTAGQVSCLMSYGQSRKWGVWNAYNRAPVVLKAGDATTTWTYSGTTIRAANGTTANSLTLFSGLAELPYSLMCLGKASIATTIGGNVYNAMNGIGYNSTTARSGYFSSAANNPSSTPSIEWSNTSSYEAPPALGINVITMLEQTSATGTLTFFGTEAGHLLTAKWMA